MHAKEPLERTFIKRPIRPVELTVTISTSETTSVMIAAATGPIMNPPITMMTSFRSNDRNPATCGKTVEITFAT